jgi:hypothetical protein
MKLAGLGALALAAGLITFHAQADEWDKKTILTVDQPIQITDAYLEPGTYVLKLANSSSDRHIVYIYNKDQNHLIDTVMAINNYRLQATGNSRFIFWETPSGSAKAMRAWFYPGENYGQEFRYPKHLRQLAAVTPRPERAPAPAPETSVAPLPAPEPETPAPAPQALREEPRSEEPPVEIAQNNTPPTPEPAPPAVPSQIEEPQALPKTASPYPLIGLSGLFSIGLFVLLRMERFS